MTIGIIDDIPQGIAACNPEPSPANGYSEPKQQQTHADISSKRSPPTQVDHGENTQQDKDQLSKREARLGTETAVLQKDEIKYKCEDNDEIGQIAPSVCRQQVGGQANGQGHFVTGLSTTARVLDLQTQVLDDGDPRLLEIAPASRIGNAQLHPEHVNALLNCPWYESRNIFAALKNIDQINRRRNGRQIGITSNAKDLILIRVNRIDFVELLQISCDVVARPVRIC